jgi:Tfp pilus assembly protein PilX
MRRRQRDSGAALILLLGITATLAILAATAVFVLANEQGATATDRTRSQSFDYAEAGLDSAVMAVRTTAWPVASSSFAQSTLTAAYDATYPSDNRPALIVKVYDDQPTINEAITWDKGSPASATTPDGKLWVEASVTYNGETSRVRTLVGQVNSTGSFSMPAAAIYTDGNVAFTSGGGDAFGIRYPDPNSTSWVADTGKNAAIYAGGSFSGNWSTDLSPNGGAVTLQVKTNGTVYNPKLGIGTAVAGSGGVPALSTVLPQATIDTMTAQAKAGTPTKANASGTVVNSTLLTQLQKTSPQTYTASSDLVVNGNLTLGGGESTFNFKSLYVTGNLTLNGNTHTNATSLYVGGNFTISGPSGTSQFGPIYVGGAVNWGGALTVKTTDYTDATKDPGPIYVGGSFTSAGGPFGHVFGPMYVQGAVTFSGNNAQILCPLLVSPGQITTSGSGGFGTVDDPMILLGIEDGTSAKRAIQLSADAVFTGLLVNMDGGVNLDNDGDGTFFIRGAVMATGDVKFTNNGNVGYDPRALANLQITAATTTTTVVPGTWQELSPN